MSQDQDQEELRESMRMLRRALLMIVPALDMTRRGVLMLVSWIEHQYDLAPINK